MSKAKLTLDSDLSDWLPSIDPEELHQLRLNLERDGCIDPILHWRGKIIDGHNRYELCEELGIPYQTRELKFDSIADAKLWMIENQSGRRNWTQSQAAMMAAKKLNLLEIDESQKLACPSGESQVKAQNDDSDAVPRHALEPTNLADAAREADVDREDLRAARKVLDRGAKEVVDAVMAGDMSVRTAAKLAVESKKDQRRAARRARSGKPAVKEKPKPPTPANPKDETGVDIPADLLDTFAARAAFDEALNHLTAITKILNPYMGDPRNNVAAIEGGQHLQRQRIQAASNELRICIRFAKPYAVCPKHDGAKCLRCGGRRWMTKDTYERCGIK
jgi:ParB-like chromosome segregation protein Spo0J